MMPLCIRPYLSSVSIQTDVHSKATRNTASQQGQKKKKKQYQSKSSSKWTFTGSCTSWDRKKQQHSEWCILMSKLPAVHFLWLLNPHSESRWEVLGRWRYPSYVRVKVGHTKGQQGETKTAIHIFLEGQLGRNQTHNLNAVLSVPQWPNSKTVSMVFWPQAHNSMP